MGARRRRGAVRDVAAMATMAFALFVLTRCGGGGEARPDPTDGGVEDGATPSVSACGADLLNDPKNCGRCGHDGLGAPCAEGRCVPVAIAEEQRAPSGLAIDAAHAYFVSGGAMAALRRVPLAGGVVESNGFLVPSGIAVDDVSVYAVSGGTLYTFPKEGFSSAPGLPVGSALPTSARLRRSGPYLLVVDRPGVDIVRIDPRALPDGGIERFPSQQISGVFRPGCGNPSESAALSVAALGDALICGGSATQGANDILRVEKQPAGAVIPLVAGEAETARQLVLTAGAIVWATTSAIRTTPHGGGAAVRIPTGLGEIGGLAVDEKNVYFTTAKTGLVATCPIVGCIAPRILAEYQPSPAAIAVDASHVYWLTESAVMRVAK